MPFFKKQKQPRPHTSWSEAEKTSIGWSMYTNGPNHAFIHLNKFNISGERELTDSEIQQLSKRDRQFRTIEEDGKTIEIITGELPMEYWDKVLKQLQNEYKMYTNHKKVQLAASKEQTNYNDWALTKVGEKYALYDKLMSEHGKKDRFSHNTVTVVPEHMLQRYVPRAALGRRALERLDRIKAVGLEQVELDESAELDKLLRTRFRTEGEHIDSTGKFVQIFNR
jgi:hypothetical protein